LSAACPTVLPVGSEGSLRAGGIAHAAVVGMHEPQCPQRDRSHCHDQCGVDDVDLETEPSRAAPNLGARWRSISAASVRRATQHGVGDEYIGAVPAGRLQQSFEPASRHVAAERDARSSRAESSGRFTDEHDRTGNGTIRGRENAPASVHGRAGTAGASRAGKRQEAPPSLGRRRAE
jgi:hypothetical protein